ncbi:hypothetical protein CDAR_280111 [Caerostris darwini]|uniref:Uncharacterized protein n=1 Tax=Caerostris darwini TaxID=1538125 RepID=A0AAV4SBL0_9ARAC|nr:hypothetical protein CDAR_280111 [Caerostris darwini]
MRKTFGILSHFERAFRSLSPTFPKSVRRSPRELFRERTGEVFPARYSISESSEECSRLSKNNHSKNFRKKRRQWIIVNGCGRYLQQNNEDWNSLIIRSAFKYRNACDAKRSICSQNIPINNLHSFLRRLLSACPRNMILIPGTPYHSHQCGVPSSIRPEQPRAESFGVVVRRGLINSQLNVSVWPTNAHCCWDLE